MTTCGAEAILWADGRAVGTLRCELTARHGLPHEARLHWEDAEVIAEDDDGPAVEVPFGDSGHCLACGMDCTNPEHGASRTAP